MTREDLFRQIKRKRSFLCIGLDTDIRKIPPHLLNEEDPIYEFNKQIIDATKDLCVAYKPNIAFYESMGVRGWESLRKTLNYIPKDIFTIADAKRGDIGNTSKMYARAFFEELDFDSVTIAPYMGSDSIRPFLDFEGKWAIVLALTSNNGGLDFQMIEDVNGVPLYKKVLSIVQNWGENIMFVVGATRADMLKEVRALIPDRFLLVPGIGAQGGSLEEVAENGLNNQCGLLVNSSRGIIYASSDESFAHVARKKSIDLQQQMEFQLAKKGLI